MADGARYRIHVLSRRAPQAYNNVNAHNLIAVRWDRRPADNYVAGRNVYEIALIFDIEVLVLGLIGIKIRLGAID